jgi:hypothetical protein
MRRFLFLFAGIALLAGDAAAQNVKSPQAAGFTQLFVSPCGEPYRGRVGDPYPVALWFKQADANHDGAVDKAEFRADHVGFFDALDADGNGVLDGAEVGFYERQVVPDVFHPELFGQRAGLILAQYGLSSPEPQGQINQATRRRHEELLGAAAYGLLLEPEPVRAADADLDGRVTKAEFVAAADRRFARLDKNADGKLDLAELPKTASQAAR